MSQMLGNQLESLREILCYRLVCFWVSLCASLVTGLYQHGHHVHDFSPSPNGATCCCLEQTRQRFDQERWGRKSMWCCLDHPPGVSLPKPEELFADSSVQESYLLLSASSCVHIKRTLAILY